MVNESCGNVIGLLGFISTYKLQRKTSSSSNLIDYYDYVILVGIKYYTLNKDHEKSIKDATAKPFH